MRWLDSITNSVDMNLSLLWEIVRDRAVWHAAVHRVKRGGHDLPTEPQQSRLLRCFSDNNKQERKSSSSHFAKMAKQIFC